MNSYRVSLGLAVCTVSGCTSISLPPEAAAVSLALVSSASVQIHRPRLKFKDGVLHLEAYALRQWKATTTADTHVDLVHLDAAGKQLAVETANFFPRSLPDTRRMPAPHGYMLVPVKIPAGTRIIEVRAHDGAHPP